MTRYYFDLHRFLRLLKLGLTLNRKGIAMAFVITFGLLFFIGLLLTLLVEGEKIFQHHQNYASSLLLGGAVLTSLAFTDLADPLKRQAYLMLPVSAFEKFLSMWLLTSIGWVLLFTMAYTCYTIVANPAAQLMFPNVTFEAFDPLNDFGLTAMKYYFVVHAVFLVGAARFRGYALWKTIFVLVVAALVVGLLVYVTWKDVFLTDHDCDGMDCELVTLVGQSTLWEMLKFFFWWMLTPVCWILAYLGLKEQEA
jgi:hypothetical protein